MERAVIGTDAVVHMVAVSDLWLVRWSLWRAFRRFFVTGYILVEAARRKQQKIKLNADMNLVGYERESIS